MGIRNPPAEPTRDEVPEAGRSPAGRPKAPLVLNVLDTNAPGIQASAPFSVPRGAQEVSVVVTLDPVDYTDPAKWLHVHIYAGDRHVCGFGRVGGSFTDRDGTVNPPPAIRFRPGNGIESLLGKSCTVRAYIDTPDPTIARFLPDPAESIRYRGPGFPVRVAVEVT